MSIRSEQMEDFARIAELERDVAALERRCFAAVLSEAQSRFCPHCNPCLHDNLCSGRGRPDYADDGVRGWPTGGSSQCS